MLRAQIVPCTLFRDPDPAGVHIAACGIKIILLAVDPLPAQQHDTVSIKIVSLAVDRPEAGHTVSVFIEIVRVAVDLLEFACAVGTVFIAELDTVRGLNKLGDIGISFRKRSIGIACRNSCGRTLHGRGNVIIQSVIELIVNSVDHISGAVFDLNIDGVHVSLAGNADMACLDCEGKHSVVSGAVDITGVFEIVDRSLDPAASERGRTLIHAVFVCEGRIHFFDKGSCVTGVSAVMIEFENIGTDIDAAVDDLIFCFLLDITAGEIGNCSGGNFCHKGVIVDVGSIISAAAIAAAPEDIQCRVSDSE